MSEGQGEGVHDRYCLGAQAALAGKKKTREGEANSREGAEAEGSKARRAVAAAAGSGRAVRSAGWARACFDARCGWPTTPAALAARTRRLDCLRQRKPRQTFARVW